MTADPTPEAVEALAPCPFCGEVPEALPTLGSPTRYAQCLTRRCPLSQQRVFLTVEEWNTRTHAIADMAVETRDIAALEAKRTQEGREFVEIGNKAREALTAERQRAEAAEARVKVLEDALRWIAANDDRGDLLYRADGPFAICARAALNPEGGA